MPRIIALIVLLSLFLSGCAGTSEKRQEELRATMDVLMRPQPPVITVIIPITATPRPTASIQPLPAYIGIPYLAEPALERAVAGSLAGLGVGYEAAFYTRGPSGQPVVWVQDPRFPRKLLCGAPLHFPGLGSLLVLTSTTLYESLARSSVVSKAQGCLVVSLEQGKEQVRQILERFQAYFAARLDRQSFNGPEELEAYTLRYLSEHRGKPHAQELNTVLVALDYNDYNTTALRLGDTFSSSGTRVNWQYRFTANPVEVRGSDVQHIALAYARTLEVGSNQGLLAFASPRLALALQNAPSVSLYKTSPLNPQEILAGRLGYDLWQVGLLALERLAGLQNAAPYLPDDRQASTPYFAPLAAYSGFPTVQQFSDPPDWTAFSNFVSGRNTPLDFTSVDKIILRTQAYLKDSYLRFLPFQDP